MTFVSGYQMIFNLFKIEQIYYSILYYTMVLSSTIIVPKNDRVWQRNATITDCRPTRHGTVRKGHKLLQNNKGVCQVPIPLKVNKLCSDNTKICLDIGPVPLVSKL